LAAGCTSMYVQQPGTMATVVAAAPTSTSLARTQDFIILRVAAGDTYVSLARTYLGDAALADLLADANGGRAVEIGRPLIVPLKTGNASGVFTDGYQTVPILCYHQFAAGRSTDLMVMSRDSFAQQMDYLKNNNYHVISLADLQGFLAAATPIPPRSVVITIDDGFRSAYDIAYPVLKSYGFRATFFIYTDFVGAGRALTWAQIKELRASGIVDVQSHSKTHTSFSLRPGDGPAYRARLAGEIDQPQVLFQRQLNERARVFAYPYGDSSRLAAQMLRDRGYELAVTVTRGGNASFGDPLMLRRDMVYSNVTMQDFQKYLRVYSRVNLK
ncbi:MAG TPA: polysaccharide deacetylase family protein, partial [Micropepsaceae bacterium]|nr:polysaccharide deacetylase family protein [Micropepsaceae bacterium]